MSVIAIRNKEKSLMCGRVNVTDYPSIEMLMNSIDMPVRMESDMELSDKLFPYFKPLLAGFINQDGQGDSALMNWGWQRDWDTGRRLFNSRRVSKKGQGIWQSRVWGDAIRKRRCLIPINAFYEWNENQAKGKRDRYRIETHEAAFTLGGIYEINDDGELFLSICTTEPNKVMADIHHRMPVIIDKSDSEQWLRSQSVEDVGVLMDMKPDDYIVMNKETDIGSTQSLF